MAQYALRCVCRAPVSRGSAGLVFRRYSTTRHLRVDAVKNLDNEIPAKLNAPRAYVNTEEGPNQGR